MGAQTQLHRPEPVSSRHAQPGGQGDLPTLSAIFSPLILQSSPGAGVPPSGMEGKMLSCPPFLDTGEPAPALGKSRVSGPGLLAV